MSKVILATTLTAAVLKYFNHIESIVSKPTKETRISLLTCKKVKKTALVKLLETHVGDCECPKMASDVNKTAISVGGMMSGGQTKLFVCHSRQYITKKLEMMCVVVRAYLHKGEEVVDYCITQYTHDDTPDWIQLAIKEFYSIFGINSSDDGDLKNMIEAIFVNQMVERGMASVDGNKLFVTLE